MDTLLEQLTLLVVALAANILSSLAGGGAGLVQLPALIFLGLPFALALATHKIATVALGIGASIKHARAKTLTLPFAFYLLATGLPGVVLGANTVLLTPEAVARVILGFLTIGLGVYSYAKPDLGKAFSPKNRSRTGLITGGAGLFFLGFLNGAFASGTGLFVTLWLISWFGLDYKRAVANTMIIVGLFWNGGGAITLALLTPVQWDWLPALLVGSMAGGYIGAHIAVTRGNPLIKRVFEVVTVLVGLSLIATVVG